MAFNINRFKDNVNSYGYAKNSKFEVFVQSPPILQNSNLNSNGRELTTDTINNVLRYRIDQVIAPGAFLMSTDTNRYGIGPTQKMPFNSQFSDTTFSILVDQRTFLWDFWYNWINAIFNFNGQEPNGNNLTTGGRIPKYNLKYKDQYSTIMMILVYSDVGEVVKTINLYDAFPSSIAQIPLSWNDTQGLMRLSITVTYSQFSFVGSNIDSNNPAPPTRNASLIDINSTIIS
jgi:hypothetical protein